MGTNDLLATYSHPSKALKFTGGLQRGAPRDAKFSIIDNWKKTIVVIFMGQKVD